MRSNLKKALALVLSFIIMLSFFVTNDTNVYAAASKVKKVEVTNLKKNTLTLNKGSKKTLSVKVSVTGKKTSTDFTVKSSNKKVAAVKKSGKKVIITAKKDGKANITITSKADKKKKTVVKVSVVTPVKGITMSTSKATIKQGKTLQLKATVSSDATNKKITWSSSNTGVATVSSTGLVTAKKVGTTTITAKAQDGSGKQATCVITVNNPNAIASVKVIGYEIVEVVLDYSQKLTKNNFQVHKKWMKTGKYNSTSEIKYIETKDNKTYILYLSDEFYEQDFVRVSVSGLTGVSGIVTKEVVYETETKIHTTERCIKMAYNQDISCVISPLTYMCGYWSVTNTELPPGMHISAKNDDGVIVSGTPSKTGVYRTTFRFTDELGNIENQEVVFLVGDVNHISAYVEPIYDYTGADGKCYISVSSSSIYVLGGSGSYKYEFVGNTYGLSMTSSGSISGYIYGAGTYKINIKVTDTNNEKLTSNIVWTINIKQGITVAGIVKDAEGQCIPEAEIYFVNTNTYDKYFDYDEEESYYTGSYGIVVPTGTYDVYAYCGNTKVYVGRKQVTKNQSGFDLVVPVYRISINSGNKDVKQFSTWYDSDGNSVGSGDTLYLREGTYNLKTEGSVFIHNYSAVLNITVNKNQVVTPKLTVQTMDTPAIAVGQTIDTQLTSSYKYFKFVPTETGTYYFYSSSSNNTYGAIYTETGTQIKYNNDDGVDSNFEISYKFTAGTTYYLAAKNYNSGTISVKVGVSTQTSN